MTTLREAAEMALEALEDINKLSLSPGGIALPGEIDTAMDLLRTVLDANSKAEPFGYFRAEPFGWALCAEDDDGAIALYEAPPQQQTEYGSEADAEELLRIGEMPEPLLLAALLDKTTQGPLHGKAADCLRRMHNEAQRKPLTDEALNKIIGEVIGWNSAYGPEESFARAIERAHGIGSEE